MDDTIKVNVNYDDYTCKESYDVDTNTSLIDVYNDEGDFIGDIENLSLPDMEDEEEVSKFTDRLSEFINDREL